MADENQGRAYEYNTSLIMTPIFWENPGSMPHNKETILSAMRAPMEHNDILRAMAWWAYRVNGSVAASVNYARSIFTLDKLVVRKDSKKKKPRNFGRNSQTMSRLLDTIRYKELVRDMILKCCCDGMYVYYLETTEPIDSSKKTMSDYTVRNIREINSADINATIISLPLDFCRIVYRKNNSYVVAFNLDYFSRFVGDNLTQALRGMPAEIREAYHARANSGGGDNWVVLDSEHTIVGKIRTGINQPWGEPLVIAALNDVLYSEYFVDTKRHVLDQMNHQIIYQTFPEGAQKGTSALTRDQQEQQHNKVKQAIITPQNRQGISFFSLPGGTEIKQVEIKSSLFEDNTESDIRDNVATDIGIAPAVLTGKSSGNYATSVLNIELFASHVYTWIEAFVDELNKAANACVIKDPSCPVGVYIMPTTFANRDKFVEQMQQLYTVGKGSLTFWIAATGVDTTAYLSLMEYELDEDYEHRYPVHATSYNAPVGGGEAGRPVVDDPAASSTISTRANDSNNSPKPSV